MATQIVTFPSDSGQAITESRPDVRLVLPNDGAVYDLSQSRVRVTIRTFEQTDVSSPLVFPGGGVIDRRLQFKSKTAGTNFNVVSRESFIRNVRVSDQKHGVVDLRRLNNTLMSTLNEYQRSRVEKITAGVFDTYAAPIDNYEGGGFFLEKHTYNGPNQTPIPSVARDGVLDIPLSDLTDLARNGESRLWPTAFTGETVFELEMEPASSFVANSQTTSDNERVSLVFTNAQGGAPVATDTVFMSEAAVDYDACPFYINQPVVIGIPGAAAVGNTIVSIQRLTGANATRLLVTLSNQIGTAPTGGAINIGIPTGSAFPPPPVAFEYVRVELQMVRVMNANVPANLSYMSYRLRDLSQSTQTEFTTTVQVPSDRTPNVLVMWKSPDTMQSTCPEAVRYRFSVNDEYEAPPITFRTSQHHEMIVRGFRNAGMTLRDLNETLPNLALVNSYLPATNPGSVLKVIMAPMPLRPQGEPDTVVQLEIEYNAAAPQRLLVYSQQISTLQLRDAGVESGSGPAF